MLEAWEPMPRESSAAHARFRHFCEQGPARQLRLTAQSFGVALSTISEQASRFQWRRRAAVWDQHQQVVLCATPERIQEAAAALSVTPVPDKATREAERAFLEEIEVYRGMVQSLAKAQMTAARGMTEKAKRSVAALLQDEKPFSVAQLPAFVSAATTLAAAAQQHWSKSIGVDRLLQQMEQALTAVDAELVES